MPTRARSPANAPPLSGSSAPPALLIYAPSRWRDPRRPPAAPRRGCWRRCARRRAAPRAARTRPRTRGRASRRSPPGPRRRGDAGRSRARALASRSIPRVGSSSASTAARESGRGPVGALALDDRERQALALAAGQVARVALSHLLQADLHERGLRRLVRHALVHEEVAGFCNSSATRPAACTRPLVAVQQAGGVAHTSVDLPAPFRPISATLSPGAQREVHAAQNRGTVAQLMPHAAYHPSASASPARPMAPSGAPHAARASCSSRSNPRARSAARACLTPRGPARGRRARSARPGSGAPGRSAVAQAGTPARRQRDRAILQRDHAIRGQRQRSRRCSASRIAVPHSWFSRRSAEQLVARDPVKLRRRLVEDDHRGPPASAAPSATR